MISPDVVNAKLCNLPRDLHLDDNWGNWVDPQYFKPSGARLEHFHACNHRAHLGGVWILNIANSECDCPL